MQPRPLLLTAAAAIALVAGAAPAFAQINWPVDFRVGTISASTTRNVSVSGTLAKQEQVTVKGFEATLAPPGDPIGIGVRRLTGTFAAGPYTEEEARAFLGAKNFMLEGAFVRRTTPGVDSTKQFVRAGFRSIVNVGASGVSIMLAPSYILPFNIGSSGTSTGTSGGTSASSDKPLPAGWEGETALYYTLPKIPLYVHAGYRLAYFGIKQGTAYLHQEEMSGLNLGVGLWLGGR